MSFKKNTHQTFLYPTLHMVIYDKLLNSESVFI